MPIDATISLDTLTCLSEHDRSGGSEPYVWPFYIWSDRQLQLRLEFLEIVAGSIANPSRPLASGMRAGDSVDLPFPPFTREIDFLLGGEGVGLIVVLLEADDTPNSAMTVGRNTLRDLLRDELRGFVRAHGRPPNTGEEPGTVDEIKPIVERIQPRVEDAISDQLNFWQKLDQAGSGKDDFLDSAFFWRSLSEDELLGSEEFTLDILQDDADHRQHYQVKGTIARKRSNSTPPRCAPQKEALRRAQDHLEAIEMDIAVNQAQLHRASPAVKEFLVARIRELKDELPQAKAAVVAAKKRLDFCLSLPIFDADGEIPVKI